jgi:predicted nucleotidyltransferase
MQLTENDKIILLTILGQAKEEIYLFGSRMRGSARPDSDLDICIKNADSEVPLETIAALREKLINSSLSFQVDLVDYYYLNDDFRNAISQDWAPLNTILVSKSL